MFTYNLSPIEDLSTEWLRSNLRRVLDEVNIHGARYAVHRRGRPVAGIVPVTEARALFEASRIDRRYREIHRKMQIDDEDRLRNAVRESAEAARW